LWRNTNLHAEGDTPGQHNRRRGYRRIFSARPLAPLITGANEGIGRCLTARYLAAGSKALVTAGNSEKLARIAHLHQ
jgi:hypothetical protein